MRAAGGFRSGLFGPVCELLEPIAAGILANDGALIVIYVKKDENCFG